MSIAALREELLRELAVAALDDVTVHRPWVFNDKGPGLIREHVQSGAALWFAPGVYPDICAGQKRVIRYVVHGSHVPWVYVEGFSGPLFIESFLENVLAGHVQDAP